LHHFPSAAIFRSTSTIQRIGIPLRMSFHLFILDYLISFATPKWGNECLESVEKESKKEGGRVEKTKRKERRKGKKILEEAFRTIGAIYIEPLASRPPPIFRESNESSREERDVKQEIFEALKHVTTMGEGLEKTLQA